MLPNEKHEFSGGWRAAQKGGLAGYTTKQASGLHIKLGRGKGRAIGLPFSAVCPALFRSPPDHLFVQPAPLSSVQSTIPPKVHIFHLVIWASSPLALQLVLSRVRLGLGLPYLLRAMVKVKVGV